MQLKPGLPSIPLEKSEPNDEITDLTVLGTDAESLKKSFKHYFNHTLGRDLTCNNAHYYYSALAMVVRDRIMERWKATLHAYEHAQCKRAYYISMEFLMGRALTNSLLNLHITQEVDLALKGMGLELEEIDDAEPDAGLGNGGLGRLAACFLDSCATLQLPVRGYGLRYEYGMFRQEFKNGHQLEEPDHWLRDGHPWELERPEYTQHVLFGGHTEHFDDDAGNHRMRWRPGQEILAVPYDVPIPGFDNGTVNTLRLWKSEATDMFNLEEFNAGSYTDAVAAKNKAENITMVLYPNDKSENGKELRLMQQYFLASASMQDVIREWLKHHGDDFSGFAECNRFQLNDTHPTVAVAELMRLLMDDHAIAWETAWDITTRTMAYTNHTLLPEALERWPVWLFEQLLPRPLEIIHEINARFLSAVAHRWPGDTDRLGRMSIIEEGGEQQVRMAYLAIVGSFSVNGVAELHSQLLKEGLFRDFYEMWPTKFNNKTNGVTQRRWLAGCNPGLRGLIGETIGEHWIHDLTDLRRLIPYAEDAEFRQRWDAVKQANKQRLAEQIFKLTKVRLDTGAMFDVQVKRIHEYKRQLLNILHVIHLYIRIKSGDTEDWTPRAVIIGGKAAPGYDMAKLIIKLINNVAKVVNEDDEVGDLLKVVFFPNYRVSAMEVICPATDLSEQISTAGKEASGTGNMKFMMNGALTIGTLDGANIEIREEVGDEHFFLFGLDEDQVEARRADYDPSAVIAGDARLVRVMGLLESGHFSQFEQGLFAPITRSIRDPGDLWMTAADFSSYVDAQEKAAAYYQDREAWVRSSILNSACSGKFSTDRTIDEYNREIWKLEPVAAEAL